MTFGRGNNGHRHLWSLAVEEHFYFIWPVLVYFLNKKKIKIAVAAILIIAFLCRLFLIKSGNEAYMLTFGRMDELAIGALLAVWESDGKLSGKAKGFLISFLVVIIPTILIWVKFTGRAPTLGQVVKYNLVSAACFCVVGYVVALRQDVGINKLLTTRFFSLSGKISYGLYVYHPLVFSLIVSLFPAGTSIPQLLVACFGATYLIAFISYRFFESKFIAMKKYFGSNEKNGYEISS